MEKNRKKQILKQSIGIITFIFIITALLFVSNRLENKFEYIINESKLQIIYFDVGQADSTLIMNNGKTILIDGGNDSDGPNLVKYIKSQKISKIDTIIATHLHADHVGGLDYIVDNFDIGTVYMPDTVSSDKQIEEFLDALERKNLKYEAPEIGRRFNNGLAECEIMYIDNDAKDLNNSSIVMQMSYLEQKYLFMGDSEKEVESSRNWNKINVLKVGHHGSNTSSTSDFLNQIRPEIAIISVGLNNQYSHPSDEVLKKLKNIGVTIYRTDEDGSILIESDGKKNDVKKIKTNY